MYKSTGSFTITFFVSAAFVLVGVSLIYVVQRLRPDLVRKPPLTMEEVIFSLTPSIHSLSVVDTLSGLCVTEPSLPASHIDPMEFASYQRFDSPPREDSRANFVDNTPGKMATQAEMEAVYRQAIERMSREMKSNSCSRKSSDISNVTRSSAPVQLSDGSARGSVMSTAVVTSDTSNPSGLQIDQGEKCDLSKSSETKTAIEEEGGEHCDIQEDRNQEPLVHLDGSSTAPEGQPASTNLVPSPKNSREENDNTKDNDLDLQTQQGTNFATQVFPQQSNEQETALEGPAKEIDASEHVPSAPDQGALQDTDDTRPLLNCNHPSEEEISVGETKEANEFLELVRIPPPPSIPRTGRLVAIGLEEKNVQDRETTGLTEPEGSLLSNASLSEISFDTGGNDQLSSRGVSPPKRRRPQLPFVDQLNLLSERLEAVAARQIQEEELGDGMVVDQRPVFSPAMQSLHLTPLYSANQSVPLTPARTWSSFVNTPVPTPRHTQHSTVHTSTVPTPIPTPQTLSHSVSGVFNVCADTPTSNIIQTQNSNNVFDLQCSPTPSQASGSGRRSGGSSLPETGQGSMDAFGSKRSSCTSSSIANDSISVGDINSMGEPVDVIGTATRERDGAHQNSPVNPILDKEMDLPMANRVQQAHLQSQDRRNPFLDPCLSNHQAELKAAHVQKWANQQNESVNQQISRAHVAEDSHFNNEIQACLPQHLAFISIEMENNSNREQFHQEPVALNPFDQGDECGIPQRQNQEDTIEVEDCDANSKLDQNIVPIKGSSSLLGFPIIQTSLDSNSDYQQEKSSEVPQIPCLYKNEVCITIPGANDSTNRITSDPIDVPSTQQRQLPKNAAETEQNPFLDTETTARLQRNPFKEKDLCSKVCDPIQACLPQHLAFISIEMENNSNREQFHQEPVALNPFDQGDECGIPQRQNQEDTIEVEDCDANSKLDQNIVPIKGSSSLLGFPIIQTSLDSNSDYQQEKSSEVPQIPCLYKNEVCITIPGANDSTNRITSDPIDVPSTQQRQLPKNAAETEQNPFLDTETTARLQRNPFKEKDLCSKVCDPIETLNRIETDSITVSNHEIHQGFNSKSHLGQDSFFKDDQHVLFQENGLQEIRGVHDDGQSCTATDAVDLTNLNSFLGPREEEFKNIYSEDSPLHTITLTNAQDVTDIPQNIPHHSNFGAETDTNIETAVLAECVLNKDTQLTFKDCTLPADNSLEKSDGVSISPRGADGSHPQHDDADLVGNEMGPQDDLQETILSTQPEPIQTELTALESIQVASGREYDQDPDSKNDWTTFSHGEEVLIFEMDTDNELTDSANSSRDSPHDKRERTFDVDQSSLFPPLQIFSDDKVLIDDHGPTTPQKLPPPPRQVQRKRIDTPISITQKSPSQSASVDDSHVNIKGLTIEGTNKENQEELTPKERVAHEDDTCSVPIDDSSEAENTLSDIQSDSLTDSKLEQTTIPCSSRLSDNSISEILCEEFEADDVKDEIDNPNLEGSTIKSSIHDDIAPLLMQSTESTQYLNLRDLPVDSGVLRGRTSTASSADNSSISSTSTDSSLSENETPYCKLQECSSDSSQQG